MLYKVQNHRAIVKKRIPKDNGHGILIFLCSIG